MWVVSLLRGYNGGYSTRVRVLFPKEKKMGYCPKADKIPSPLSRIGSRLPKIISQVNKVNTWTVN